MTDTGLVLTMLTGRSYQRRHLLPKVFPSLQVCVVSLLALAGTVLMVACGSTGNGDSGGSDCSADSDCRTQDFKLTASDAVAGDGFGESVAVSGDVIVVGARRDDNNGNSESGSAYVFRLDGTNLIEERNLTPDDSAEGDFFGDSVAVSGDVIVVGASLDDNPSLNSGSAYVFRFDGAEWIEEQKLTPSDSCDDKGDCRASVDDRFGHSVAVSGDVIVAGAIFDRAEYGSAYVFRFNGTEWIEDQKLVASDAAGGDEFGRSVAVSGDVIVVGA
ncbi:MAG: FG-GAP repeat protein, partial [Deltaproteobacteria bacterium]|nr:FG-GAP repeat protein [Deltaproteobacteria bacterium]